MAHARVPPRIRRVQASALALLVIAGTLNYVDRAALSIANPLIREELGLSIADMGLLLSAFLWAYAFSQLPGGALTDRLGPRRLLGLGLFVWSLAQAAAGLVGSFWQFVVARVFLGAGEAPMFSGAARVVRDWWNVRDRGLPTGIWNCASSLGPTIAPPLLTVLMISFGWRWMFVSMGLLGIVVAIVWYTVYREVAEAALSPGEAHHLTEGEEEPARSAGRIALLGAVVRGCPATSNTASGCRWPARWVMPRAERHTNIRCAAQAARSIAALGEISRRPAETARYT